MSSKDILFKIYDLDFSHVMLNDGRERKAPDIRTKRCALMSPRGTLPLWKLSHAPQVKRGG